MRGGDKVSEASSLVSVSGGVMVGVAGGGKDVVVIGSELELSLFGITCGGCVRASLA